MCVEINNMNMEIISIKNNNKKTSYSVKKLLKKIFKQHSVSEKSSIVIAQNIENAKKASSLESLESLENSRNADIESVCASVESYENQANERLSASCEIEDYDLATELPITIPVHFVRTEHGTFFWTATSDIPADNDLIEPLNCSSYNEIAVAQYQDRWAQA